MKCGGRMEVPKMQLLLPQSSPKGCRILRQIPPLPKCQQPREAKVVVAEIVETSGEIVVAADPTEADKIINVKIIQTKIKIHQIRPLTTNQNLTKKVLVMLMGLQIAVAPGTGPKVVLRPTAPIPSSAVGPPSSNPGLKIIIIEK